ncbi:MAG: phospholipase D-like domain-containing protein [Polyangiales bacterium]
MRVAWLTLLLTLVGCAEAGTVISAVPSAPVEEDDPEFVIDQDAEATPLPDEDAGPKPPEPEPEPEPAEGGVPEDPPPPPPPEDGGPPEPPSPPDPAAPAPDAGFTPEDCRRSAGPLQWSCSGPIAGAHCVSVNDPDDSDGWRDNVICTPTDIGLRWSSARPYEGMRCTAITEPADPHGWSDNFLCLPSDSPWALRWSHAGAPPAGDCVPWIEPRDPHPWSDNYLCLEARPAQPPPRFQSVFSVRPSDDEPDGAVEDAIVSLIRRALPRSRVRVAVFTFTRSVVAQALIDAHNRGVDVRVVVDGGADDPASSAVPALIRALGRARVTVCGAPGTACLGTGIMHHKTSLFSALDDGSRSVVVQSSHNFSGSQRRRHNNAVIVRGDSRLFAAYERVFEQQRRDIVRRGYYHTADGSFHTRAYFFPRDAGDTVVSVLNNVDCRSGGRVRVAMAFFTNARLAVAEALRRRRQEGCDVQVVVGDAHIPIGPRVRAALRDGGVGLTLYRASAGGWALHSKYLLIDARYAGSRSRRRLVFTGSHNWTGGALRENDETLLRVEDDGVFESFMTDWSRVRAAASRP